MASRPTDMWLPENVREQVKGLFPEGFSLNPTAWEGPTPEQMRGGANAREGGASQPDAAALVELVIAHAEEALSHAKPGTAQHVEMQQQRQELEALRRQVAKGSIGHNEAVAKATMIQAAVSQAESGTVSASSMKVAYEAAKEKAYEQYQVSKEIYDRNDAYFEQQGYFMGTGDQRDELEALEKAYAKDKDPAKLLRMSQLRLQIAEQQLKEARERGDKEGEQRAQQTLTQAQADMQAAVEAIKKDPKYIDASPEQREQMIEDAKNGKGIKNMNMEGVVQEAKVNVDSSSMSHTALVKFNNADSPKTEFKVTSKPSDAEEQITEDRAERAERTTMPKMDSDEDKTSAVPSPRTMRRSNLTAAGFPQGIEVSHEEKTPLAKAGMTNKNDITIR